MNRKLAQLELVESLGTDEAFDEVQCEDNWKSMANGIFQLKRDTAAFYFRGELNGFVISISKSRWDRLRREEIEPS